MRLRTLIGELHRRSIWQVLAGYVIFTWLLFETFEVLRVAVGLPEWVEPTAAVLLIVLFPAVLATASIQKGAPKPWPRLVTPGGSPDPGPDSAPLSVPGARAETPVPPSPGVSPAGPGAPAGTGVPEGTPPLPLFRAERLLTWRNTLVGGAGAFALLALATAIYMILRTAGIGPAGTLVAQGTLDDRERMILADFASPEDLSDLATVITEGMRVDLAQSPTVRLHSQRAVSAALVRMEREPDAPLDLDLAREVALREAVRGVVAGELSRVGSSFVISAEVVDATDGAVLVSRRVTARDMDGLVRAVDDLSKKLRERIGEPLASIGRADPLERVTTGDLEALRRYSSAVRAIDAEGAADRGQALLEEAVALDPSFAMAWRKLGIALSNRGEERTRIVEALTQAFEHRDRLTPRERDLATAGYYWNALGDAPQAMAAYERLLEREPDDGTALNNLGDLYLETRDVETAIPLLEQALAVDSTATIPFMNLIWAYGNLGDLDAALAHVEAYPWLMHDPTAREHEAQLWASRGEYDEAVARLEELREDELASPYWRTQTSLELAALAAVRGRLAEAERHYRDAMASDERRDLPRGFLIAATRLARMNLFVRGDVPGGLTTLEFALAAHPLDGLPPLDRPYLELAEVYAHAGQASRARALLERFDAEVTPETRSAEQRVAHDRVRGAIALASGDVPAGIEATRASDRGVCLVCALPQLAEAWERAGQRDSAIAAYERYVQTPYLFRVRDADGWHLGPIHERLGQLYEARGDREKAAAHYARLARLWDTADDELRPRVDEAVRRAEALLDEGS